MVRILLVVILLLPLAGRSATVFWPGARYDAGLPTVEAVLGHPLGERITTPAELRRYFEALAAAAPDRLRLVPYATSWEGRELFYVVIARPERMERLDAIRASIRDVAFPDDAGEAGPDRLVEELPATVWLSYGVHGNEISSPDAAAQTAYHLLASQGDAAVDEILADAIVFIDPLQNPDGRGRFVQRFRAALGLEAHATRLAAEHDEPWPSGRVNHYLFDLNRDWLPVTQPETRGRVAALQQWYPLVYVDAHEMGSDSTYFFAPEADPYNPHLAESQRDALALFGRNNARWFDRFGFEYFTREVYDAFYPGYGASWPAYYGAIAMTYEQASPRGLRMRRLDGTEFTYADAVRRHFVASIATAQTAAVNRARLWREFLDYRRSAKAEGARETPRAYVVPGQRDQGAADKLAGLLAVKGIDVYRLSEAASACGRELGPGAYVVPLAQASKRLIRTVMDPRVEMDEAFLARQEALRSRDLPDEIYDVTAWSLPLMFNVETVACDRAVDVADAELVGPELVRPGAPAEPQAYGWLAPGGDRATFRLMAEGLRAGLVMRSPEEPFRHQGREWPAGTLVIRAVDNEPDVARRLSAIAARTGARLTAVDDSWVTEGPSFGSEKSPRLVAPVVALAWDAPTSVYAPGAVRFVLERQFGYPVIPVRTRTLARSPLDEFDVIILPDTWRAGYSQVLGDDGLANLASWVERGGVLVTLAGGTRWAAHPDVDLLAIRAERQFAGENGSEGGADGESDFPTVPGTVIESETALAEAARPEREAPDPVPGVLVRAEVDPRHWLSAGVAPSLNVLVRGSDIFSPMPRDEGYDVARFAAADELLLSGHLWEENRRQLAYKPFVVAQRRERGLVIGFAQDPTVRAYLDGLNGIFVNAVLRAPAYTRRVR